MNSPYRRVNFYAGPGCGKSTLAARVFAELKIRGCDVEHIPEYVKTMAHEGRVPKSYDQLYIFAKQVKAEDVILRNVSCIVTDSPILMNTAYSTKYGFKCAPELVRMAQQFDRDFPAINFYIDRTVDYIDKGRYQNYDQAVEFDKFLLEFLDKNLESELVHVKVEDFDLIVGAIQRCMEGDTSPKWAYLAEVELFNMAKDGSSEADIVVGPSEKIILEHAVDAAGNLRLTRKW